MLTVQQHSSCAHLVPERLSFLNLHKGLAAVLTWKDFNFDPPFYDIETGIMTMYFKVRFEEPTLKSLYPVLNYELFKDRDLVFLISESPVFLILTRIFNNKQLTNKWVSE